MQFLKSEGTPPVFICSWTLNALPVHMPLVTAWHLWSRSWAESGAGKGFKMTFRKQYRYQNSLQPGKAGQTWRDKYQVRKQKTKVLSYGSLIAHVQPASLLLSWTSSLTALFLAYNINIAVIFKRRKSKFSPHSQPLPDEEISSRNESHTRPFSSTGNVPLPPRPTNYLLT